MGLIFSTVVSLRRTCRTKLEFMLFSLPVFSFVPLPLLVPDNAAQHLCTQCLCQPDLGASCLCQPVCSAVRCVGHSSTITFKSSTNCIVLMGVLSDCQGVQQQPLSLGAPCPSDVHLCSSTLWVALPDRSYILYFLGRVYVISWGSL